MAFHQNHNNYHNYYNQNNQDNQNNQHQRYRNRNNNNNHNSNYHSNYNSNNNNQYQNQYPRRNRASYQNSNNNNYHQQHYSYYSNNRNNNNYNNNHNNYQQYNNSNKYNNNNNYNQNKSHKYIPANKNVKFVTNTGKMQIEKIPNHKLPEILQTIYNNNYHQNSKYISSIIFLCGTPGSGKTSICKYVKQYYNNNNVNTIDVSDLTSQVMKENNRRLITSKVYNKLYKQLLQNQNQSKILIIDGFLRLPQHVFVVNFLKFYMKNTKFIFLVIFINQSISVQRQIERGKRLKLLSQNDQKNNDTSTDKVRLKASDLDPNAALKRYRKYEDHLKSVIYLLKNEIKAEFEMIDGTKPLAQVYQSVDHQLKEQTK